MMTRSLLRITLAPLLLLPACDSRSSSTQPEPESTTPLMLAVGMTEVQPVDDATARTLSVDTGRLHMPSVDRVYRVTTPVDTPFSFDLLSEEDNGTGLVRVAVAHAADGGQNPDGVGMASLAKAGCLIVGNGLYGTSPWLNSAGEGFCRLTVSGKIQRPQVIAVMTEATNRGIRTALVEIAIGPASDINQAAKGEPTHPGVLDQKVIYSSDSWGFGVPTVATSGDRTTVVTYEGLHGEPLYTGDRYEMGMQYDRKTGKVTGGAEPTLKSDSGHWRDHEIAALYNVLAVTATDYEGVSVRLSFDRGGTFAQTAETEHRGLHQARLTQVAMAADYSLAIAYWEGGKLMLWEGRPTAFDPHGSPTWFGFTPPMEIFDSESIVTPLITGMTWSDGGDLVIGHAFSHQPWRNSQQPITMPVTETQFWCSVRPWGGVFEHCLVDQDRIVARDPSVAVLGEGASLRIFYAYEGRQGVRLRVSEQGCEFSDPIVLGNPGAHTPTVFARTVDQKTKVDVLFLTGGFANELHVHRWLDYGQGAPESHRLSTSVLSPSGEPATSPGFVGYRQTQVGWMGYDATLDGDEIVAVFDEDTVESQMFLHNQWGSRFPNSSTSAGGPVSGPLFRRGSQPPLAPGMTRPIPAPDPAHRHQLRLIRFH